MHSSAVLKRRHFAAPGRTLFASAVITLLTTSGAFAAPEDSHGASRAEAPSGIGIVGGTPAKPGQWLSLVAVYGKREGHAARYFCAGTVIGREWVLTAAHCGAAMKRQPDSTTFFIREGMNEPNGEGRRKVAINANQVIIHPRYDPRLTQNDVALLKLSGKSSASRQKLASRNVGATALKPGRKSTVVGFGAIQSDDTASMPVHQLDVPIVEQRDCRGVYGADKITGATFCAGLKEGGRDACSGTGGGPLLMPHRNGEQMQVGIVSWGKGCAEPGHPTVYVPVGQFQDWIRANVRDAVFTDRSNPSAAQSIKGNNDGSEERIETR